MVQIINPETNYIAAHSGSTPSNWYIDNAQGDMTLYPDINMENLENFVTTYNVSSLIHVSWPARQTTINTWKVETDSGSTVRILPSELYNELGVNCTWGSGTPSFDIVKG